MNDKIIIKGARVNNLKNIDIELPRNKMIIMTGLSGSGKTSLAFDTIYAEGQRRYVESLSSYARQFLGGIEKPDVDEIKGLSPAISIDQKTTSNNPRSTVGTVTEIYDYLRLLYARCGTPYCPTHHKPIEAQTVAQMISRIMTYEEGTRLEILAPIAIKQKGSFKDTFEELKKDGYLRVYVDDEMYLLEDLKPLEKNKKHTIKVIVDRLKIKADINTRLYDSLETALKLAKGLIHCKLGSEIVVFSANYACPECGFSLSNLEPRLFSFNSPLGACDNCKGLGMTLEVDVDLLIPNPELTLNQGAIRYYKNIVNTDRIEWQQFAILCKYYHIDMDKPLKDFSKDEMDVILYGSKEPIPYELNSSSGNRYIRNQFIEGIKVLIERRYQETTSNNIKEYYRSFMRESTCTKCHGTRLNSEALCVEINGLNIYDFTSMSIDKAYEWISNLQMDKTKMEIARLLLVDIKNRLKFLIDVGLGYITLSRMAATLSGGEAQRIRLATQIGSGLTGVLYVLDEPSIGLHQRDNGRLINSLKNMRDLGNTLIIVEHDEETMMESDYIVDIGPGAGKDGGEVVAIGTPVEVMNNPKSITGLYLSRRKKIDVPTMRRKGNGKSLKVYGASEHNLKNINVTIPLGTFTCVSGVSGSGKSTLVNEIITKAVQKAVNKSKVVVGKHKKIEGLENIDKIIHITQDPIGRTPRSNPATYTGVFDDIRDLFAMTPTAKERGFDKSRFSFNVPGGRCEVCQGDGVKKISMLFVPDVYVECEECHGRRYNEETLTVTYKDKNIYDILKMSVKEGLEFFHNIPKIKNKLQVLYDVGLGYIELGQSATTLSGGEAQRVKLASELQKKATGKTLFVLDEPTTGLHTDDVKKLIGIFERIVDNGDTVLVIEHNLDVLKSADYLIDLGPEGGDNGGQVIAKGTPEKVAQVEMSYTGQYLKKVLED